MNDLSLVFRVVVCSVVVAELLLDLCYFVVGHAVQALRRHFIDRHVEGR